MNSHKSTLLDFGPPPLALSPLEKLLVQPASMPSHAPVRNEVVTTPLLGKIVAIGAVPLVDFPGNPSPEPLPARHTCPITAADIGREAVLIFERADYLKPIILGLLRAPAAAKSATEPVNIALDGEQLTLTAKNEIVLRCGKASITLTSAGKVLIRGAYLLNRSSGVNRIKGGSVQIN